MGRQTRSFVRHLPSHARSRPTVSEGESHVGGRGWVQGSSEAGGEESSPSAQLCWALTPWGCETLGSGWAEWF